MSNKNCTLALLAALALFISTSPLEAQSPLGLICDPISGSNMVHISFMDPGVFFQFDVTVNGVLTMVLPATGGIIKTLVTLPGPGGHVVCVMGIGLPTTVADCCQFVIPSTQRFVRGDANADGGINIADVVTELNLLFLGMPVLCLDASDSNDDGGIDIADPIYLVWYILGSGPPPPLPHPLCGPDPTADPLNCVSFPPCP